MAGQALWGRFATARAGNLLTSRAALVSTTTRFAGFGLVLAVILCVAGPVVTRFITGDSAIAGSSLTFLLFGSLIALQATQYPSAMLQTDIAGVKFQAVCSLVMCALNLGISYVAAQHIGLAGPILGSVVAFLVALAVPTIIRGVLLTQVAN